MSANGMHPDSTPTVSSPLEGIESLTPAINVVPTDSGTLTTTFWARYIG